MRAYAYLWVMTLLFFLSGGAADQIATSVAMLSSDETWMRFIVSLILFGTCWCATMLSLWVNPHMDVGQCAYAVASLFSVQSSVFSTSKLPRSAVAFSTFQFIGMSLTAGFGSAAMGFLTSLATESDTLRLIVYSVLYLTFSFIAISFTVLGLPQALHTELDLIKPRVAPRVSKLEKVARFLASILFYHEPQTDQEYEPVDQREGPDPDES